MPINKKNQGNTYIWAKCLSAALYPFPRVLVHASDV